MFWREESAVNMKLKMKMCGYISVTEMTKWNKLEEKSEEIFRKKKMKAFNPLSIWNESYLHPS